MSDFKDNDTFTEEFKDMVERVGTSDEVELAKQKVEYGIQTPIPMDEEFKEEVLTVVKAIKICESDANSINIGMLLGSFFASGVSLYAASLGITQNDPAWIAVWGSMGLSLLILSIMGEIKTKKRAAQDALAVRTASGLDEPTLKVILQQLAEEGNEVAKKFYEHYTQQTEKGKAI